MIHACIHMYIYIYINMYIYIYISNTCMYIYIHIHIHMHIHIFSEADFTHRVEDLFWRLDVDNNGQLNYQELFEGFRKMEFQPAVKLSQVTV